MTALDQAFFHLPGTGNREVADVWYELALQPSVRTAYLAIDTFLCAVEKKIPDATV